MEIVRRLDRIEKHLGIPPQPQCDHPGCGEPAVHQFTSGQPPITRRWCRACSPGIRNVTNGLTVR